MDFNFYELYKSSTTVELLTIVAQPEKYQPAAVDAAKLILRERKVSEAEEIQAAEAIAARQPKGKKGIEEKSLSELLDPLTESGWDRPIERKLYIFLAIVSIYYSWEAYTSLQGILIGLTDETFRRFIIPDGLRFTLIITMLYFLWNRAAWGWRLLLGYSLLGIPDEFEFVYTELWIAIYEGEGIELTNLLLLALKVIFVVYMWRDKIANHFSIYRPDKWKAVRVTIIVYVILSLLEWMATTDVKIIS